MKLHFLKSTWDDILLLEEDNHYALIDTGFAEQFRQIQNYFSKLNIKKLDFIFLTHFHRDHYGNIVDIIKNYQVDTVYFKDYSGLDGKTATGMLASFEYRLEEMNKCNYIKENIRKYSKLIIIDENIRDIKFNKHTFKVYATDNKLNKIFNDKNSSYYKKYLLSENYNSCVLFANIYGKKILLSGDITDSEKYAGLAYKNNYKIAKMIKEEIDIYKLAHHGDSYSNSKDTLNIYKPKYAIITNTKDGLLDLEIENNLISSNKDVVILYTDKNIILEINSDGSIKNCRGL